ncbi:NifU family protein [Saccharibacter floricola]|uniref:Nitrogen fixing thioredoxin-like protein NifU n=1 Tax=Saccharibacter floricola DSM 15669 TaxID=1123227 RepID=A0ABQ0NZV6_9PROT|nr:NifU family protein [Saccharibacter floricola]GBQ07550.1 nitrogen fixing thioredoxin-like protein NifU [Saccharibacter floricola DSM 15669]
MLIETEDTPNPATLKFLPGRDVTGAQEPVDFAHADAAKGVSPLAEMLFALPEVQRVFLGEDFVSVTKVEDQSWPEVRPLVLTVLTEFFASGKEALTRPDVEPSIQIAPEDEEVVSRVRELLDTRVRPAVAGDGGDIAFRGYRDGIVYLAMQGACSGCPSSRATLRHGVENMLRHYVPEVEGVEAVEE